MFLKVSQYSQKNTCVGVSFNKAADLKTYNFIKKRLRNRCFPVNIVKLLRTAFFIEHLSDGCFWISYKTCWKQLWRKSFLGRVFLRNLLEIISSLCCSVSKNNSFTGFSQFLSFFKHVRGVSRTQSNIKMEPIAKIVNGSRGVFRTKWKI